MKKFVALILLGLLLLVPAVVLADDGVSVNMTVTIPPSQTGGATYGWSSLRIYDLQVTNLGENSTDISWKTSRRATGKVTYWASPKLEVEDTTLTSTHLFSLKDLKQNTTYQFRVYSKDWSGASAFKLGTFTTLETTPPPADEEEAPPPVTVEPPPVTFTPPPVKVYEVNWWAVGGMVGAILLLVGIGMFWTKRR